MAIKKTTVFFVFSKFLILLVAAAALFMLTTPAGNVYWNELQSFLFPYKTQTALVKKFLKNPQPFESTAKALLKVPNSHFQVKRINEGLMFNLVTDAKIPDGTKQLCEKVITSNNLSHIIKCENSVYFYLRTRPGTIAEYDILEYAEKLQVPFDAKEGTDWIKINEHWAYTR